MGQIKVCYYYELLFTRLNVCFLPYPYSLHLLIIIIKDDNV